MPHGMTLEDLAKGEDRIHAIISLNAPSMDEWSTRTADQLFQTHEKAYPARPTAGRSGNKPPCVEQNDDDSVHGGQFPHPSGGRDRGTKTRLHCSVLVLSEAIRCPDELSCGETSLRTSEFLKVHHAMALVGDALEYAAFATRPIPDH
jgi:hypothetical protein